MFEQHHQTASKSNVVAEQKLSCAIVLATYNRLSNVLIFLDSVARQTVQPDELIIVDASAQKLTDDQKFLDLFVQSRFPCTKLVYTHTTPGLTYQRNVGAAQATAEVLHFLDDDTVLDADYLERMTEVFVSHPDYAGGMGSVKGVGPKIKDRYRFIRTVFCMQRDHADGKFTVSGMPTHTYGTARFKTVEVLGGCCMAYRSWVFTTHHFDETLSRYSYMEDCDFSRRVSYDHPLFFNPQAQLEHHHSPLARDRVEDNRAMFIRNYSYLFFKNFYPRNRFKVVAYWWTILGLFVEAAVMRDKAYLKGYWKGLQQYRTGR